jgi:hypothetical protein
MASASEAFKNKKLWTGNSTRLHAYGHGSKIGVALCFFFSLGVLYADPLRDGFGLRRHHIFTRFPPFQLV